MFVFAGNEQRDPVLREDLPPFASGDELQQPRLSPPGVAPLADHLGWIAPLAVVG